MHGPGGTGKGTSPFPIPFPSTDCLAPLCTESHLCLSSELENLGGEVLFLCIKVRIALGASAKIKNKINIHVEDGLFPACSTKLLHAAAETPFPSMMQGKPCILLQEGDGDWKSLAAAVPQPHLPAWWGSNQQLALWGSQSLQRGLLLMVQLGFLDTGWREA